MGHSFPEGILTNADLEKIVDTNDEWIFSRTGIKQRRKAAPGEYTSQFAVRAARQAIDRAGLRAEDIDLLLCATVSPDQILPSTSFPKVGLGSLVIANSNKFYLSISAGKLEVAGEI